MSTEIPVSNVGVINYGTSHILPFGDHAAEIGLTAPEVATIATLTATADTSKNDALAARQASKAATVAYNAAVEELRTSLVEAVAKIKARAKATGDDNIYALAEINPPQPASPRPAPETPENLVSTMDSNGVITLTWEGSRAFGVSFLIERRTQPLGGSFGEWKMFASMQRNEFVDSNVPAGLDQITYRIKAMRDGKDSPWSGIATVNFGPASQSSQTESEGNQPMSMAA